MTAPQPAPEAQQLTPAEQVAITAIATWLATSAAGKAVGIPADVIDHLVRLGYSRRASVAAFRLGTRHIRRVATINTTAVSQTESAERLFRARYILAAAKRITATILGGAGLRAALRVERPNFDAHLAAQTKRVAAALAVDELSKTHRLLRWHAIMDGRTTEDCRALNGTTFTVADPPIHPVTGRPTFPGQSHPQCRCTSEPAQLRTAHSSPN